MNYYLVMNNRKDARPRCKIINGNDFPSDSVHLSETCETEGRTTSMRRRCHVSPGGLSSAFELLRYNVHVNHIISFFPQA